LPESKTRGSAGRRSEVAQYACGKVTVSKQANQKQGDQRTEDAGREASLRETDPAAHVSDASARARQLRESAMLSPGCHACLKPRR